MSKYTVVTYQPLKGPRMKYWIPFNNPISQLLHNVGNSYNRCTREPISDGVLRLKGPVEFLCFLETILDHDYGIESHSRRGKHPTKHPTFDVIPITPKSKKELEDEIKSFKLQTQRYEQLSNLSASAPVTKENLPQEKAPKRKRIDPEDEANPEIEGQVSLEAILR